MYVYGFQCCMCVCFIVYWCEVFVCFMYSFSVRDSSLCSMQFSGFFVFDDIISIINFGFLLNEQSLNVFNWSNKILWLFKFRSDLYLIGVYCSPTSILSMKRSTFSW